MTGWPWPLDGAQEWFESLWNWISDVGTSIYNDVTAYFDTAIANFVKSVTDTIDWLKGEIAKKVDDVSTWLSNLYDDIVNYVKPWLTVITNSIASHATWIKNGVEEIVNGVKTWVDDAATLLYNQISPALTSISTTVGGVAETVTKSLMEVLDPAITGFSERVNEILTGMGQGMAMGFETFWNWLISSMRDTVSLLTDGIAWGADALKEKFTTVVNSITNQVSEAVLPRSPSPEIEEAMTELVNSLQNRLLNTLEEIRTQSIDIEGAVGAASKVAIAGMGAVSTSLVLAAAADATHPFKKWGFDGIVQTAIGMLGVQNLIAPLVRVPYELGITIPLRYYYNKVYEPAIPTASDLITFMIREIIPLEDFKLQMSYQGFSEKWSQAFYDAHWLLPSRGEVIAMVNRGIPTPVPFEKYLELSDVHPDWRTGIAELRFAIPPIPDIIRFRVREVISEEDYFSHLMMHAMSEKYADWYWQAHFVLPSFLRLRDAWHRGELTDTEFEKFLFWHDYSPDPREGQTKSDIEIMKAIARPILTDVDLRRGWRVNQVTNEEMFAGIKKLGFSDADAERLAIIQRSLALESDINSVVSSTLGDFKDGFIDEATLRADLSALSMRPEMIDYNVRRARTDRRRALDKKKISTYLRGFRAGTVPEDELRTRLIALGLASDWVRALIEYETITREVAVVDVREEARRLTKTDVLRSFKNGIVDESTARDKLEDMGYPADDVNVLIELNRPAGVAS